MNALRVRKIAQFWATLTLVLLFHAFLIRAQSVTGPELRMVPHTINGNRTLNILGFSRVIRRHAAAYVFQSSKALNATPNFQTPIRCLVQSANRADAVSVAGGLCLRGRWNRPLDPPSKQFRSPD